MKLKRQENSFAVHWISFKCWENFRGSHFIFVLKVLKKAIAQKIHQENFVFLQKSAKATRILSLLTLVVYNMLISFQAS